MAFKWDVGIETGHAKIDNQHKQLIMALNNVTEASQTGKGEDEIFKALDFLSNYAVMHFNTEERLQVQYDYPDFAAHKSCHEAFRVMAGELTRKLVEEGPTGEHVGAVTKTIGEWMMNHIRDEDIRMAAYVRSKNGGNGTLQEQRGGPPGLPESGLND
ncbi:MAG: hemerythrin family protein [Treponema sp.]|nr:hemerythrin family protein [Treponema sp.]